MERLLLYGLCVLLFVAPLPFGSVQEAASAALSAACLVLGTGWVLWRARRGLSALPWKDPVLIAGALFVLVGIAQLVPLPRPVLGAVSPRALELRERYEPPAAALSAEGADRSWRPVSLYPWATRQATLRFIAFLLVALIVIDLAGRDHNRRLLVLALVASGGFQAIYGLAEYFSGRQHIFGYAKKYYTDVATGTFINRNHFAGYLEMTLPLAVALAAVGLSRLRSRRRAWAARRMEEASGRALFATTALLILSLTMMTALICSRSRMGIVSALVALLAVGLFLAWRGRGRSFAVAAVLVAGVALLLFSQADATGPVVKRFLQITAQFHGELGRWSIWSQSSAMLAAFPVLGVGFGVFPHVFAAFRTVRPGVAYTHAHNDFLELAAEAGLVGVVLALAGLLLVGQSLMRRPGDRPDFGNVGHAATAGLVAIGVHSLTDFNLAIPSNALTAAVLAGMVVCWMRGASPVLALDASRRERWLSRSWAPASVMTLIALAAAAPVLAGAHPSAGAVRTAAMIDPGSSGEPREWMALAVDGDNARRLFANAGGKGRAALDDLQVLIEAQARGAEPTPLAAGYLRKRLEHAIALQSKGLRHHPTSSAGHLKLAQLQVGACVAASLVEEESRDCVAAAMPELRAALDLSPMSAATHARAARFLIASWPVLERSLRVEGRAIIERAAAMNREDKDLQRARLELVDNHEATL